MNAFVLVAMSVIVGFLVLVWHRLAVAPRWGARWPKVAVAVIIALLFAATLAGFDVWGGSFTADQMRPVVWVGQAFLATCWYLALGLLPVLLLCIAIWFIAWRHDHGRMLRTKINRIASPLVAAAAVGVTVYGAVAAGNPTTTAVTVTSPALPPAFDGAKVALVTDLHAGAVRSKRFTQKVVDTVNASKPDLVVLAGDLVDGNAERYETEIGPLADLKAPLGVFATTGNHEMFNDTAGWVAAYERLGITVLRNEDVTLTRGGETITLAGVNDWSGVDPWAADYGSALGTTAAEGFTILSAHQPRQAFAAEGKGVDLQLSGHTHGGQLWPIRYLVTLQQPVVDGLHTVAGVPVLTSRGAGAWGPPVRVGADPEIPIVTLRRG